MAQGDGLALLEERLVKSKSTGDAGFDPVTIITIITALIPLIQGCFSPKPQSLRRRFLNRSRVAAAIRRADMSISFQESFVEADNLFSLADQATNEELQLLIDDCSLPI